MDCDTPFGQTPGFYETCIHGATSTGPSWALPLLIVTVLAAVLLLVRIANQRSTTMTAAAMPPADADLVDLLIAADSNKDSLGLALRAFSRAKLDAFRRQVEQHVVINEARNDRRYFAARGRYGRHFDRYMPVPRCPRVWCVKIDCTHAKDLADADYAATGRAPASA